ncbi:P-loop containing nucleoside triphosphate hydrolase protein [Chaetomium fimeti]|uniref:P-loop containing nucleoside triphosphate hydrolase protein n=1 Tax=Chaetomium fimeti TaxID=1854472 RepID=A0AAE0HBZ4_9PEZI|nr:P-loop containing nucleoside triphosphate hydrolase protein [Chaetomium fimeti]
MAPASKPESPLNDLTPLLESLLIGTSPAAQFVHKPITERDPNLKHESEAGSKPVIDSALRSDLDPEQPWCRRCKSPHDSNRSLRKVPCCGTSICNSCTNEAANERLQNDFWNNLDSHQWVGCLANACQMFSAPQDFDNGHPVAEVSPSIRLPHQGLKNAERAREVLGSIRPRPARREWELAQRLHKSLADHKLMPDWSQTHLDMLSASSFPVRSGFLTQPVPIMTGALKTESKTCTRCSTTFQAVETSNEAAWAYVTTAFPGDWAWMILGHPSKKVLPECAGKHSLDICPACLPKLMFSGLEFLDAVSGSGNYRFVCPMCKHVFTPVQVERVARLIDPNRPPATLSGFSISTHSALTVPTKVAALPKTVTSLLGPSDKARHLVGGGYGGKGDGSSKGEDSEGAARRESLISALVTKKPNVRWDDVAGLTPAKHELQRAIIFPARFPNLYDDKRKPSGAILLYGPPGTGKSYLAKAVATEADHTFFSISPSDVTSKWVGESEKLIRQLFALAREHKPSLIFIDEIDSLCASREDSGRSEHSSRMKTELLIQLDGLRPPSDSGGAGDNNSGVVVLAATNLPWTLDPAFRRRFQPRLHIPLPDRAARRRLFEVCSSGGRWGGVLGEADVDGLAGMTEGFSGSDVAQVVGQALSAPLERVQTARFFRVVKGGGDGGGEDVYAPCEGGDEGAVEMTWEGVPRNRLREPPVTVGDFERVLRDRRVKASVGVSELQRYEDWTHEFGVEGRD